MNKKNYDITTVGDFQVLVLNETASLMFAISAEAECTWSSQLKSLNERLSDGMCLQVDTLPGKFRVDCSSPHVSCSFTIHDDSQLKKLRSTRMTVPLTGRIHPQGTLPMSFNDLRTLHETEEVVVAWSDERMLSSFGRWRGARFGNSADGRHVRKKPKPSRLETSSAVRIVTTPEVFRSFLNASAKGGIFCVAADRGMYAVFNGDNPLSVDNFPKLKKKYRLTSAVNGQGSAGTYYRILYDTLYRRKQGNMGILNALERTPIRKGEEPPEFSFGLSTDNRLFVELRADTWCCRVLFNNLYEVPTLRELPNLTVLGVSSETEPTKVVEATIKSLTKLSSEEEAIVSVWKTSSDTYRDARNAKRTENRKLMFNDHVLVLAMSGRGPSEEDLNLLKRL